MADNYMGKSLVHLKKHRMTLHTYPVVNTITNQQYQLFVILCSNLNSHATFVGMKYAINILENSLAVSNKIKYLSSI